MALLAPTRNKLGKFINHKVKVVLKDHRYFVGQMLAFDSHSNIVIKDCEEFRELKKRKSGEPFEIKRNLGLMLLRGDSVMRIDVIGPAPAVLPKPPGMPSNPTNIALIQQTTAASKLTKNAQKQAKPQIDPSSLPQ